MLPVVHPIAKTAIELRRSINRLVVFKEQSPNDEHVLNGSLDRLIGELKEARAHIPADMRDVDLTS